MAERLKSASGALLLSYSKIFFSESRLLGVFILLSTLVIPSHGIFGVLGALFANAFASVIGMDKRFIQKGVYGFNGVLAGLALGFFYNINAQLVFILLVLSIVLTFLTIFLNATLNYYLGLPAMSMPFNIITWLVLLASIGFGYLHPSYERWTALNISLTFLPYWLNVFFSSLGAVLFQINTLSGLIIAAGILLYSRIAFLLIVSGFMTAVWMHNFLGVDSSLIEMKYLGFNYMLSALAIGGVFTVPSPGSFFLALVASALSVLLLVGAHTLFPPFLSPLALPFNLAVLLILYGLRMRLEPSLGVYLAAGDAAPEENLSRYRENLRQWKRAGTSISLPFHGRWKVSQGIDGAHTHKERWRFAYDFQAVDFNGNANRNNGSALEDYYAYGLPVLAPADGTVRAVKNNQNDNPVGKVDAIENWGNYVILEHAQNYYSCLCHLQLGSVKVMVGQRVKKGEPLANCGNSGRSPYPHLHFQFQSVPETGAPALVFEFSNILIHAGETHFQPRGALKEKSVVQNITVMPDGDMFFPYSLNKAWTYALVKQGEQTSSAKMEAWTMDVDFYGNTFLLSSPKTTRLTFQLMDGVFTVKKLEGRKDTGLFFFGSAVSEVPFLQSAGDVVWGSLDDADYCVHPFAAKFFDIFSIFGVSLKQKMDCRLQTNASQIILNVKPRLAVKTPFSTFFLREMNSREITFEKNSGVTRMKRNNEELHLM